jgi:hypothetical protein
MHFIILLFVIFLFPDIPARSQQQAVIDGELVRYLKDHWMNPEEYVLSRFKDHDYVFIGEIHYLHRDADLILHLIPALYDHGIYTLGIEFADHRDQHLVDSLLALPVFDRALARKIFFRSDPVWAFKEYIDIYRVAWEVNHAAGPGAPRFRVVNLAAHFDPCKKGGAWKDVDPDRYMAGVIFSEILPVAKKALIYSGSHHAFTRYHQPSYSFQKDTLWGLSDNRMGNIVYDSLGNRVFNIFLNAPWVSDKGWDAPYVTPVNGTIDRVMSQYFPGKQVGFDVVDTPFGRLTCDNTYYTFGYPRFTLSSFCDGFIYRGPSKDFQLVTVEKDFVTPENIGDLKTYLRCTGIDSTLIRSVTPENFSTILSGMMEKEVQQIK